MCARELRGGRPASHPARHLAFQAHGGCLPPPSSPSPLNLQSGHGIIVMQAMRKPCKPSLLQSELLAELSPRVSHSSPQPGEAQEGEGDMGLVCVAQGAGAFTVVHAMCSLPRVSCISLTRSPKGGPGTRSEQLGVGVKSMQKEFLLSSPALPLHNITQELDFWRV